MHFIQKLFFTIILTLLVFLHFEEISYSQTEYSYLADLIYQKMNYTDPIVRDVAVHLAKNHPGKLNIGQICEIYDFMFNNWNYVEDPNGSEFFAYASESLDLMAGDCDDFAIALSSLICAIGGSARVVLVPGHAFSEVYIGSDESHMNKITESLINRYSEYSFESNWYHVDSDGSIWLNLDWSANYPGGVFYNNDKEVEHLVIYPDGSWRIALLNSE